MAIVPRTPRPVVALAAGVLLALAAPGAPVGAAPDLDPYRGLGVWVDVFDYASRTQPGGGPPPVTPDSVDDMAKLGARTLYLHVVNPEGSSPDRLFDAQLVRALLLRARLAGLRVVAWYLPSVIDVDADTKMLETIARFGVGPHRFDSIALDLEDTTGVPDVAERNKRIVRLARRARRLLGGSRPLGAIVYPAVQLEVVNPGLWPDFPYRQLASSVDVWLPMAYYTFRDEESGYRDAARYTEESVRRLRDNLRDQKASVHVIGGIADLTTPADYQALVRAANSTKSIGYSVYDYATTSSAAWPYLRGDVTVPSME